MDLFKTAEANVAGILQRLAETLESKATAEQLTLQQFAEIVRCKKRVSINLRPWALLELLAGDCYQNAYDLAEEESRILDIPISDLLERKFGDYYRKRVAFDQYFDRGRWFRYGALNIGGVGARIYGEFCIILDGEAIGACLAFVAGDSLKTYVDASGTLDETAIIRDAVPLSHCHCLATIVVGEQIIQAIESDWPMIVCSDVNYLEAIFLGEVKRPLLSGIRISESDYQRLFDLVYPRPARKLEEAERALAHDFIQILGAIKIESLILERIAG